MSAEVASAINDVSISLLAEDVSDPSVTDALYSIAAALSRIADALEDAAPWKVEVTHNA